jgi:hypothetical protein
LKKSGGVFTHGYQHRRWVQPDEIWLPFCPVMQTGSRIIVWSVEAILLSRELEGKNQAKPDITVAILRVIVIPIDRAAVHRIIDPAAATENTVRTLCDNEPLV